jgi:hypothetical protein
MPGKVPQRTRVKRAGSETPGCDLFQQFRTFLAQRIGPSGQCLVEFVPRSRTADVDSELSELFDLGGREPE